MATNHHILQQDLDAAALRLQQLEATLGSLPADHPAEARAALVRLVNSEKQLLQRLQDLKLLTTPQAPDRRRSRFTLLVLAVVIVLAVIGVMHAAGN
jgi:LPS O-antigen subunit length determinant protein (WzzB/FepE family)